MAANGRIAARNWLSSSSTRRSQRKLLSTAVKAPSTHDKPHALFNYTSGRWLYNEPQRLQERFLPFNVTALSKVMATSVDRSSSAIIDFRKLAEGGSYRVFEATFDDGLRIIARLPYPCTVPLAYGIASEVATIEFLKTHDIPVPTVLDWSASSTNEVGSPYIVMEKVTGAELEKTWWTMNMPERARIMEKIVDLEAKLFKIDLPGYRSLYPREFLAEHGNVPIISMECTGSQPNQICIGPSVESLWWYRCRDQLQVNRGPWNNPGDVLMAVGQRELAWLQQHGKPRHPRVATYKEFYGEQKQDPAIQMQSLRDYLKIAPLIVPDEAEFNKPTLRHPDLSPNNIFISSDGAITSLIDWQNTTILPLFLQAGMPKHIQNYGDEAPVNFRPPELPPDFENLSTEEKEVAMEVYRRRQVHFFYAGSTGRHNKSHFSAMTDFSLMMKKKLYLAASRPWEGENATLKAEVIRFLGLWNDMRSSRSKDIDVPIKYADDEMRECLELDENQRTQDDGLQVFRDHFPIDIEGWVSCEDYEIARERAIALKTRMLDDAETAEDREFIDREWPFQDHEEID